MRLDAAAGGNVPVLGGGELLATVSGRDAAAADLGAVVLLDGSIEAADDVSKTHASAFDSFRSLNRGPLGRVDGERVVIHGPRGPRRQVATRGAATRVFLVVATVATDGTP